MPVLNWIGKEKVVNHYLDVPFKTLERRYSFDERGQHEEDNGSENMIIHGDNLEALKALLPKYEGKVDCIYIDPPYNTAHSTNANQKWVYNDNVDEPRLLKWIGEIVDDEDVDLSRHDKWLCMMYPRLQLLRKLMSNDAVIFISIDDNEQSHLKIICDEIFGRTNFVAQLVWEKKKKGSFLSNTITNIKEYVFVYCKNIHEFGGLIGEVNYETETYPCINATNRRDIRVIPAGTKSNYKKANYSLPAGTVISDTTMNIVYLDELVIENNAVAKDVRVEGNWRYSAETMTEYAENKELYLTRDLYIRRIVDKPRAKMLKDLLFRVGENPDLEYDSLINPDNLIESGWGSNEDADEELRLILGAQKIFEYPKPSRLIEKLLLSCHKPNGIVLDSFAGSGTTAHAVLELNKLVGGSQKFICIELMDYAETITAKRVKKVIEGYDADDKHMDGIPGTFSFYELGEQIVVNGVINESVDSQDIKNYIYYTETHQPYCTNSNEEALLGVHLATAYYFNYDKCSATVLDRRFLKKIKTKAEAYVIYADVCNLSDSELEKYHITFKKIPRDIRKF